MFAVDVSEILLMWVCSSGIVSHLPPWAVTLSWWRGLCLTLSGVSRTTWTSVKGQNKCSSRRPACLEMRSSKLSTQVRAACFSPTWWCVFSLAASGLPPLREGQRWIEAGRDWASRSLIKYLSSRTVQASGQGSCRCPLVSMLLAGRSYWRLTDQRQHRAGFCPGETTRSPGILLPVVIQSSPGSDRNLTWLLSLVCWPSRLC